ncbi:MAG: DUF5063 domain-containing protein [Acidobacteriota bacterium]
MSDSIEHFFQLATSFVRWTSRPADSDRIDAELARLLLASLYGAALSLPLGEQPSEPPAAVSDEQWNAVVARFSRLPFRYYTTIVNPLADPVEDQVVADLADDLADIHRDLQNGLSLVEHDARERAAWHWRFTFHAHWGRRAIGALGAVHAWLGKQTAAS